MTPTRSEAPGDFGPPSAETTSACTYYALRSDGAGGAGPSGPRRERESACVMPHRTRQRNPRVRSRAGHGSAVRAADRGPREVLCSVRRDTERPADGRACGFRGPRRREALASHPASPTSSAPQEGAVLPASRGRRFWLLACPGDKAWDLFSQAVAQKREEGWPLQVQSPRHVGCLCLEELPSSRSGSCSLWAPLFPFWAHPRGCPGLGSHACLPAPPHHTCALLLARRETLPTCRPPSPA